MSTPSAPPGLFGADPSEGRDTIDLRLPIALVWARRRLVALITLAVIALAVLLALRSAPEYTAVAQLSIGAQQQNYVDVERVVTGPEIDDETVTGEIGRILSNAILRRVIAGLRLDLDPDYNPSAAADGGPGLRDRIAGLFGAAPSADAPSAERAMDLTIRNLRRSLSVEPMGNSFVVNVTATAARPRKAALIANAVANAYVLDQYEQLADEGERATAWFDDRLSGLQERISRAETEVERTRLAQLETFGESEAALEARLEEVGRRLALAQADRALQEARVNLVEAADGDREALSSLPEVLESELAAGLRERIVALQSERARLMTRYGDNHPDILSLDAELAGLQAAHDTEVDRIVGALRGDLARARDVDDRLRADIRDLEMSRIRQQQSNVSLRALEAEVETGRQIYLDFLTRYREVSETATLLRPDAGIVSDARPPQFGSGTSRKLVVGLAAFLGLGLACLVALTLAGMDQRIRSGEQAERAFGLTHLGSLPRVTSRRWQRRPLRADGRQPRIFTESLMALSVRLRDRLGEGVRVVGITSPEPAEGKSILAATLSEALADTRLRVLLVEADIHRPMMGELILEPGAPAHPQILARELGQGVDLAPATVAAALERCIQPGGPGFDYLRIGDVSEGAREFLSGPALAESFARLREEYDAVIVNMPPILAVSDTLRVLRQVDGALLAVHWNRTSRGSVRSALRVVGDMRGRFLGTVLTSVNPQRAPREEVALMSTEPY